MDCWQALITGISVLLGGAITWLCSKYYYEKATKDFKKEGADLKRLNNYLLRGMEKMGVIAINRDAEGNPESFNYILKAESGVYSTKGESAVLAKTSDKKED